MDITKEEYLDKLKSIKENLEDFLLLFETDDYKEFLKYEMIINDMPDKALEVEDTFDDAKEALENISNELNRRLDILECSLQKN